MNKCAALMLLFGGSVTAYVGHAATVLVTGAERGLGFTFTGTRRM